MVTVPAIERTLLTLTDEVWRTEKGGVRTRKALGPERRRRKGLYFDFRPMGLGYVLQNDVQESINHSYGDR